MNLCRDLVYYPCTKFGAKTVFYDRNVVKNEIKYGDRCRPEFTSGRSFGHVVCLSWRCTAAFQIWRKPIVLAFYTVLTSLKYGGRPPHWFYIFEFLTTHEVALVVRSGCSNFVPIEYFVA